MTDIELNLTDGIVVARLNRPERLNAFRRATYRELLDIVMRLEADAGWRALVITGSGRAFCAGQDLDDVGAGGLDAAAMAAVVQQLQDITRHLVRSSKPTVAAINGPAVGFGLEFPLACDLRFAGTSAYFMLPELSRGLFHTNGTYHLLPRLAGPGIAADLILTGRRLAADEALRCGLVSRVLPDEQLLPASVAVAAQLASLPPAALAAARDGLRRVAGGSLEQALDFEAAACLRLLTARSGSDFDSLDS